MEKNRIYTIIFALLFLLVILLGIFNMLSSGQKEQESLSEKKNQQQNIVPTGNFEIPTKSPSLTPSAGFGLSPTKTMTIFDLAYPLKYENLIIDYLPAPRNQLIIYYPKDKQAAEDLFKKFLAQYQTADNDLAGKKVDYIGLTRDPNEPEPGSLLQ